jgi:phage terminase small subunit
MGIGIPIEPRKSAKVSKLTAAQRMFCEHLAADDMFSTVRAARKAGYKNPKVMGSKLIKNPVVKAYLGKVLQDRIDGCRLTAEQVLEHLKNALFLDPLDLFELDNDGTVSFKQLHKIPLEVRRCISKLDFKTTNFDDGTSQTQVRIETMSKDAAMKAAMQHLGILEPDGGSINVNVNGSIDFDKLCEPLEELDTVEGKIVGRVEQGGEG